MGAEMGKTLIPEPDHLNRTEEIKARLEKCTASPHDLARSYTNEAFVTCNPHLVRYIFSTYPLLLSSSRLEDWLGLYSSNVEILKILVCELGFNINHTIGDNDYTLLMLLSGTVIHRPENYNMILWLIFEAGYTDLDAVNARGETAIHVAYILNNIEVCILLCSLGSKGLDIPDKEGLKPGEKNILSFVGKESTRKELLCLRDNPLEEVVLNDGSVIPASEEELVRKIRSRAYFSRSLTSKLLLYANPSQHTFGHVEYKNTVGIQ